MFKHLLDTRVSIYLLPILGGILIVVLSFTLVVPRAREIPHAHEIITQLETKRTVLEKKRKLLESVESGPIQEYLHNATLVLPSE